MSVMFDLLDGIARRVAAAGVATYRPDGSAYLASETPVTFVSAGSLIGDRCIVLTGYTVSDDPSVPLGRIRVQARFRGAPNQPDDTWALQHAFFQSMQSAVDLTFGSVHLIQFERVTSLQMPQDDNQRFEYSDNYNADVDYPATALRPVGGTY